MLGYVRVSTREQAKEGFSLDAQTERLREEAERRGYDLEIVTDAGYSGRTDNRPGLQEALRRLKRREADGLMVCKLDRLARSVQHFTSFIAASQRQGWSVVVLDFDLDTGSPNGRLVAHILAAVAQWESEMIGQRTADGMAEAKAQGARFGRSRQADDATVTRIKQEREAGKSFAAVASGLDADGIPTPGGGKRWYASTVARIWEAAA
ncbi:Resolvase domain protein [Micromonospora sp. L5]|uniref:recombinase family protein n=1 Tax=Micromonospora sp. (strain L5) TaxID=648999 RepID=UPI0001C45C98|nr:recombinase family protein [Micromonospora sp. L5]ADU06414.1 Resolvase domain protein [Micromonospora sp. L5]